MTYYATVGAAALALAGTALGQSLQLDASSIANAASYISAAYPNGGVSHGGMFIVKAAAGSASLGACGVKIVDRLPVATSMNGTSMRIAIGGSSFDVPMIYVVACSGTDQLAGILPSNVPTGAGVLTVSYNGLEGSAPITIVDRIPGFFTLNQGGTGAGIIQNVDSATGSLATNTLATPAKPGQVAIAWATGLGPDGHSDVDAPQPTDLPITLELFVGGKSASVSYKGRSGCCAGIDQINFQVPDGLSGCFVPIVAKIENAVSNFATMSISADASPCSDPGGVTAADIQAAQSSNRFRLGLIDLTRADIEAVTGASSGSITRYDQAGAVFADLSFASLVGIPVREISTPGACTVLRGLGGDAVLNRPPLLAPHVNLDAGVISIAPAGSASAALSINYAANAYYSLLGTAAYSEPASSVASSQAFLEPGTFTISSQGGGALPGGASIGAFSTQVTFPALPRLDNRFALSVVPRDSGITLNWSGVADPLLVEIRGTATPVSPGTPAVSFFCLEKASAGQFTIPPSVLLSLPAAPASSAADGSALGLSVGAFATSRVSIPGVGAAIVRVHALTGRSVTFR